MASNGQAKLPKWNCSVSQLVSCFQCDSNDVLYAPQNAIEQKIFFGKSIFLGGRLNTGTYMFFIQSLIICFIKFEKAMLKYKNYFLF